ncbi:Saccharopine dehydrogenase-like protein [Ignavibacterium album JCM 16511]|uniref:Saccharopine dehydrogenase-like protein n=1 Tax=Ignavibacterium album (strain DSM 19864 / JCM 16511 / NBRC 101810 / Mat9-16) TaxID=945713 RepID=I0AG02_IGNAJ|nr:saccharopine dehydrogenase C-terminal domain-containing protein [Ignavibacterium album]AFH47909.1 Saccharopine dehydrogenase-like protein [Ignavibacterium album JCM 16511]
MNQQRSLKKITVLGCGLVGSAIAIDLCRDYNVTVADLDNEKLNEVQLNNPIRIVQCDFLNVNELKRIVNDSDLVISAVPGSIGFRVLKSLIELNKNVVDISFFPEDPFQLNNEARKRNLTVFVDCGVCPGLSNIILGYHNKRKKVTSYKVYVGGLPKNPQPPFYYKAPFSPSDVIEEYTRPARIVVDGKVIIKEALSDVEIIEFNKVGKLEAFNTDGLRTLLSTMEIPNMIEKTLRYPGHSELIKAFRDAGFLEQEKLLVDNVEIRPIDFTSKILYQQWKLEKGEKEFTVMKILIESENNISEYNLYDEYDDRTQTTSMARTTGYTCTAVARLILEKNFHLPGIIAPEIIGEEEANYNFVLDYLKSKNIQPEKTESRKN